MMILGQKRAFVPLYNEQSKVEIWTGVTDALLTHSQTLKDSATQLLIKYESGALVTQFREKKSKPEHPKGQFGPPVSDVTLF